MESREPESMDGMMAGFMNVMAWNAAMAMKNAMIIQNIQITFASFALQPVVPFLRFVLRQKFLRHLFLALAWF